MTFAVTRHVSRALNIDEKCVFKTKRLPSLLAHPLSVNIRTFELSLYVVLGTFVNLQVRFIAIT